MKTVGIIFTTLWFEININSHIFGRRDENNGPNGTHRRNYGRYIIVRYELRTYMRNFYIVRIYRSYVKYL